MRIEHLYRYPVKSMLGETMTALHVDRGGADGDRRWALVDQSTGRVASAKQARLWRGLLQCSARVEGKHVQIRMPDGASVAADAQGVDDLLSQLLERTVRLVNKRPQGASVERADPDQVLSRGLDAEVDAPLLELAQKTPGDAFTDLAPLHAVTTATLEHIGVEAVRYRPNVVIATPPGYPPYRENEWIGRTLTVGYAQLRALGPTPRCVIPTLEHGALGRSPQALRTPAAENLTQSFDFGVLPCVGAYLEVLTEGTLRVGDPVTMDC